MKGKKIDPLHGHCLCIQHARDFSPRRTGVRFFFIPPEALPQGLVCGRCAPGKIVHGGLMVSDQSLTTGVVTFLKNAAFDIRNLNDEAGPAENLKIYSDSPLSQSQLQDCL